MSTLADQVGLSQKRCGTASSPPGDGPVGRGTGASRRALLGAPDSLASCRWSATVWTTSADTAAPSVVVGPSRVASTSHFAPTVRRVITTLGAVRSGPRRLGPGRGRRGRRGRGRRGRGRGHRGRRAWRGASAGCAQLPATDGPTPATLDKNRGTKPVPVIAADTGAPPAGVEAVPLHRLPVRQTLQPLQHHHRRHHRRRHRPAAPLSEQVSEHLIREQPIPLPVHHREHRVHRHRVPLPRRARPRLHRHP